MQQSEPSAEDAMILLLSTLAHGYIAANQMMCDFEKREIMIRARLNSINAKIEHNRNTTRGK